MRGGVAISEMCTRVVEFIPLDVPAIFEHLTKITKNGSWVHFLHNKRT